MSYEPPGDAAPTAEWRDLVEELDRWNDCGRIARLWWRDDDATAPTPQLFGLLRLAHGIPLALAVIPEPAREALAAALAERPSVTVLQHGWHHANRAAAGKKSEYPPERPAAAVAEELRDGRARLVALFGPKAVPVFVPPWNRIAAAHLPLLASAGISALSGMAARRPADMPGGVVRLDVHVDLVEWRGARGFIGEGRALGLLAGALRAVRQRGHGNSAIGILTHHLVLDTATAGFLDRLAGVIGRHAAARWAGVPELLR